MREVTPSLPNGKHPSTGHGFLGDDPLSLSVALGLDTYADSATHCLALGPQENFFSQSLSAVPAETSLFNRSVEERIADTGRSSLTTSPRLVDLTRASSNLGVRLRSPEPRVPDPWVFRGNGGKGVKTWLSADHVLEINPHWLNFAMFDSMDLSMTDKPPGPGESEPQEWRSAFTVGLATDWNVTDNVALSAGYRFYENPVPDGIRQGAFPNASQHVVAASISLREGRHSLALIYGLDLMDAASSNGITSARQDGTMNALSHLVSFTYGFSF